MAFCGIAGCLSHNGGHQRTFDDPLRAAMLDDVELLRRLDAAGADLNAQYPDRFNWTPLIASIYFESTNVSVYLINRGVDVCRRDRGGETALTMAIDWNDTNTVALLFKKASKAIRDCEDWQHMWSVVHVSERAEEWTKLLKELGAPYPLR